MSRRSNKKKQEEAFEDLGFGTKIGSTVERLINRDGSFNVERRGLKTWTPYQDLVEMSWPYFLVMVFLFYLGVNALFALIHLLVGVENLSGYEEGGFGWEAFAHAFFFSVQTFTTVGYGAISPVGVVSNFVASICALVGLLSFALVTGVLFARVSKPRAQILFSEKALIAPYREKTSFQFRIANKRTKKVIDLIAQVTLSWVETDARGTMQRRFSGLPLERSKVYMFPLNWTIVHPIDADSPLYGLGPKDLERMQAEFLVLIEGHDETFAQTVHTSNSYTWDELVWDVRYRRMYQDEGGKTVLFLDQIDALEEEE